MSNLETLLTILGSNVMVAVFSYVTGLRKNKIENENSILIGLQHSVSIYQEIIESLREEITTLNSKITHLEIRIEELHQENKRLKTSNI